MLKFVRNRSNYGLFNCAHIFAKKQNKKENKKQDNPPA